MAEGIFPKTDGQIYYASEVNALNVKAAMITTWAMRFGMMDGGYVPVTAGFFTQWTLDFVPDTSTNLVSRNVASAIQYTNHAATAYVYESPLIQLDSNATEVYALLDYEVWDVFDENDDSSLNATNYPTSTNSTEGANGIALANNADLQTKDLSASAKIFNFRVKSSNSSGGVIFSIYDGSNSATILTDPGGTDKAYDVQINLDWAAKIAHTTVLGVDNSASTTANFPELESNKHDLSAFSEFRIRGTTGASATATLHYIRFGRTDTPTQTAVLAVSSDGGSNYTNTANGAVAKIGTVGSAIQVKLSGTGNTSEVIVIKGVTMGKVS